MDGAGSAVARPDATTIAPSRAAGSSLRLIFVATFVLNGSTSVIFALISDLQDAVGLSTASLGLIAATGFIVGLAAGLVVAPWADRGWAKRLLLGGLALSAVGGIGFAMAHSLAALLVSRALIGAAAGCFLPAARAIVAGFDPARAGENLGRLARVDLAGFSSGPIIGGVLFSIVGLRGHVRLLRRRRRRRARRARPPPAADAGDEQRVLPAQRQPPAPPAGRRGDAPRPRPVPARSGCSTRCGTAT